MQNTVNIRDLLRSHKQVLERVKQKKERVVIVSQEQPQAGIVSLDDLRKLEELDKQQKYQQSTKSMLEIAKKVHQILEDNDEHLPSDLSTRHDYYHYKDGVVVAVAKKINADGIFSFDGWYQKLGYKLASELA